MVKQITLGLSFSECDLQTSRSYGDTEEWGDIIAEVGKFMENSVEEAWNAVTEKAEENWDSFTEKVGGTVAEVKDNVVSLVKGNLPGG